MGHGKQEKWRTIGTPTNTEHEEGFHHGIDDKPDRDARITLPELEFAPFDEAALTASLARAFTGLSLVKEAQAAPLVHAFQQHLDKGQVSWLDELVPLSIPWPNGGTIKLSYVNDTPEAQVKLQDCFTLTAHPTLCEGRLPVALSLHTPDGKRLATVTDWPTFLAREWPKHRQAVAKKFSGVLWR